jgi:hypothetical protein
VIPPIIARTNIAAIQLNNAFFIKYSCAEDYFLLYNVRKRIWIVFVSIPMKACPILDRGSGSMKEE